MWLELSNQQAGVGGKLDDTGVEVEVKTCLERKTSCYMNGGRYKVLLLCAVTIFRIRSLSQALNVSLLQPKSGGDSC